MHRTCKRYGSEYNSKIGQVQTKGVQWYNHPQQRLSKQLSLNVKRGQRASALKAQSTGGNRPLGYLTRPDKRFIKVFKIY